MKIKRRLAAVAAMSAAVPATFPSVARALSRRKPTRLIVPFPPGGNADAIARVFAEEMGKNTGAPVIVDNRAGASGTIGAEAVLRAEPDGNTLLLTVTSQLSSTAFNVQPSYDAKTDFVGITGIVLTPLVVVAPASLGVKHIQEFVALAKTRPMAFGSYGAGTGTHILQAIFARQIGSDMVHVPYKGEAPVVTDLIAGEIQMGMVAPGVALQMSRAEKLQPLAVIGSARSEFLPRVPTFAELGYKDLDWTYGVGLYASSKIERPRLLELERLAQSVVNAERIRARYREQSNEPWGAKGEELQKRLVVDSILWQKTTAVYGKMG
jgi:tripartite-type tricarboxylate transporter receptor subunit TctC